MIKVHGFSCSTVKSLALIIPNIGGKWRRFNVFNLFSRHYLVEKNDQTTIASHWYVRHGMQDYGSVPLATIVVLYYALFNCSKVTDLDFAFAWMAEHAGYYDAAEACAWINETCAKAMVVD